MKIFTAEGIQKLASLAYGYFNGAWQKQPLQDGYYGVLRRYVQNASLSTGGNLLIDTVVPSNEIWIVENLVCWYSGTVANVQLSFYISTGTSYINSFGSIISGHFYGYPLKLTLFPGEYIGLAVGGATAGDQARLYAQGHYFSSNL